MYLQTKVNNHIKLALMHDDDNLAIGRPHILKRIDISYWLTAGYFNRLPLHLDSDRIKGMLALDI